MEQAELLDISLEHMTTQEEITEQRLSWERDQDDINRRFQYATVLSKSGLDADKRESILHFEHLLLKELTFVNESLYNLSLVYYSLKDYKSARAYCEQLYREQPDSGQAKTLHQAIAYKDNQRIQQEDRDAAMVTVAAVGAGLLAAGVAVAFALKRK